MATSAIVPPKGFELESTGQPPPGFVLEGQSAPVGQKLGFTGEMNPQTRQFEDVSVDQPKQDPAIVRFAMGFNKAVTGASTPSEFLDQAKSDLEKFNSGSPTPAPFLSQMAQGIHQGMKDTWARAEQEWKAGNWRSAAGLISKADAAIHAVESGIPVIGSLLSQADQQAGEGNVAGAAGTIAGVVAPVLAGGTGEAYAMNTGEVTNPAPTPSIASRIPTPIAQKAAVGLGVGAGAAVGHATGIPGMGEVGAVGGAAVGRAIADRIGKPQEAPTAPIPGALEKPPTGSTPVPAAQYLKALKEGSSPSTARMLADTAHQDAIKVAGNISREDARAAWLNRQISTPAQAHQAVGDLVTEIAPKASLKTKAQIDFSLRKGDLATAKRLLDDASEDKDIQSKMRAEMDKTGQAAERYKSRLNRAKSSADSNKGSLMTPEQVVNSMPLPAGTMEANKLLGYEGRRTVAEATAVRNQALGSKSYSGNVKDFIRMYYGEGDELKPRP